MKIPGISNNRKTELAERYFFYISILITALPVLLFRFFPTMDGAAHLYNSNLIIDLIAGNAELSQFFILNEELVPNWIGHFILSIFNAALPAYMAEKILLVLYVVFLPLSFRKLVSVYQRPFLSYLIFPFVYTFLFYLGFYNLSIAFILLFYTLAFWSSSDDKLSPGGVLKLFLLLSICWFSHILIYGVLGAILALFILRDLASRERWSFQLRQIAALAIAALPTLILSAGFFLDRSFSSGGEPLPKTELLIWLKDIRPVIALNYAGESKLTQWLFYLMLLLVLFVLIGRLRNHRSYITPLPFFRRYDIFLLPVLIMLYLYFTVPNNSGAGMMSDRYALLFFIFLIIWLAANTYPGWLKIAAITIITVVNMGLVYRYTGSSSELSRQADAIYQTAGLIESNSVILPVNRSDHWLQPHFSNYLGIDKPMVILENYEAQTGWFPVLWNRGSSPALILGGVSVQESCLLWTSNDSSADKMEIDYVFIWGKQNPGDACASELDSILKEHFREVNTGTNFTRLYRRL